MLHYNEIRNDIANGYAYMEYEGKFEDWCYVIILEKPASGYDMLMLQLENEEYIATFAVDVYDFLDMSEIGFANFVNQGVYYNSIPKEMYY